MTLILDAGAFIAVERNDRDVIGLIKGERNAGRSPVTHGGVIAQIWRGGTGRQVQLARLLEGTDIRPLDGVLGRKAGILIGRSGASDCIDAALVCLAADDDYLVTCDVEDLTHLADTADLHVEILQV